MSNVVIQVEHLSKCYRIGLKEQMSETLGGAIGSFLKSPFSNLKQLRRLTRFDADETAGAQDGIQNDLIWALSDISFAVKEGEVIGIIGRNGAGKSTLLKILSRIVEPTTGRVLIKGRVSSLLEVGTGFHQELTGRENVYLNGTILGMTKAEIDQKFDEIVSFAEVERFLDTPVKKYSSGMKVRLAFAVAAHLEPEILLVDEVLAVGDATFQKKCIGKMSDVSKQGRTVMFVSHNMAAIQNLCSRTLVLSDGKLEIDSTTNESIGYYLRPQQRINQVQYDLSQHRSPDYKPVINDIRLIDGLGNVIDTIQSGKELNIQIRYNSTQPLKKASFGIIVESVEGNRLFLLQTKTQYGEIKEDLQTGIVNCHIPSLPLVPGIYCLSFGVSSNNEQIDKLESILNIHVIEADYFGTGKLPLKNQGNFLVKAEWSFKK